MTVLSGIHRMAEIVVAVWERTIPNAAAHDVVLHIMLTVAPGNRAVVVLPQAHHDAAVINRIDVEDR